MHVFCISAIAYALIDLSASILLLVRTEGIKHNLSKIRLIQDILAECMSS